MTVTPEAKLSLDLRTDAITLPTPEMWDAMRAAELGWAHVGEDTQVIELEAEAAALTGKEAGLLLQSGSLGNLLALMTQTERGDQVVLDSASHIGWSEEWGVAYVCGLFPRLVESTRGKMDPDDVREVLARTVLGRAPRTSLLCLENSHNVAGGVALDLDYLGDIVAIAREHGVGTHLDGARLLNACTALGIELRDVAVLFDSVMINLNKGLSAPGGAILLGRRDFIDECRINLRRVGGSPGHQAGLLAAAGLVALRTMIPGLADDNRRATALAVGLNRLPGVSVDEQLVQTNIVKLRVEHVQAEHLAAGLERRGLRTMQLSADELRLVTHRHVSDESVTTAIRAVAEVREQLG